MVKIMKLIRFLGNFLCYFLFWFSFFSLLVGIVIGTVYSIWFLISKFTLIECAITVIVIFSAMMAFLKAIRE